MKPGTSREIPKGAGCPKPAGLWEETPGEEAKGGEGSTVMLKRKGEEQGTAEKVLAQGEDHREEENDIKSGEDEGDGKYEEELDPRIQVYYKTWEYLHVAGDFIK